MGFFDLKAECSACGKKVGLNRSKIKDGWLCPNCFSKYKDAFRMGRTLKEIIDIHNENVSMRQSNTPSMVDRLFAIKTRQSDTTIINVQGYYATGSIIKDSVLNRSNIDSSVQEKSYKSCPYCGGALNLPETPNYCPYCTKKLK